MSDCCKRTLGIILLPALLIAASADRSFAAGCPGSGQQSQGPDVVVGVLCHDAITNYASAGGIEAFSMGTTSCNLGNQPLAWFSGSGGNHPVIGQNLFRLKQVDGSRRFEQLGQSWLKHGFFALSQFACCASCSGTDGNTLGVGCSDPYSSSRNGGQSSLGPKWQVNATTGVHTHPLANPSWTGSVARRLQVKIDDLEVSNGSGGINATRYFGEAQYIAADDAAAGNKNNNASYRAVAVSGSGTAWSFSAIGTTQREKPGIQAWKDIDPTVTLTDVKTKEAGDLIALVIVGAQATDLGGGIWHYEYAIQNLNSDRSIGSVVIPIRPDATVTNIGFRDVDYHSGDGPGNVNYDGTDWPGAYANGDVSWATTPHGTNPNANAIRWGTLYNFRFDADVPPWPSNGPATLGYFKPGAPASELVNTVIPDPCIRGDLNNDGVVDGLDVAVFVDRMLHAGASFRELCAGDLQPVRNNVIDLNDVPNFVDCLVGGGCG